MNQSQSVRNDHEGENSPNLEKYLENARNVISNRKKLLESISLDDLKRLNRDDCFRQFVKEEIQRRIKYLPNSNEEDLLKLLDGELDGLSEGVTKGAIMLGKAI